MEKEKKNNLLVGVLSAIIGVASGIGIHIIIDKIKSKKLKISKESNEDQIIKNVKEAKATSVDQLFLVPIKREYIEQMGFGVIGAIKTITGEDEKGKFNSRIIVGLNAMVEVKEYNGKIEGYKVFKNNNDARLYVNKFMTDKGITNSKSKEECMQRLFKLLEENKKYEEGRN